MGVYGDDGELGNDVSDLGLDDPVVVVSLVVVAALAPAALSLLCGAVYALCGA